MNSPRDILAAWLIANYDARKGEIKKGVDEDDFDAIYFIHGYLVGRGDNGWRTGMQEIVKSGDAPAIARAIQDRM